MDRISPTSCVGVPDIFDSQGELVGNIPYGKEDLFVADLDLTKATRFYASRYNPAWYPAGPGESE